MYVQSHASLLMDGNGVSGSQSQSSFTPAKEPSSLLDSVSTCFFSNYPTIAYKSSREDFVGW